MVLLASEQLWPNIQGVAHAIKNEGGLDRLFIYHTENRSKSHIPAKRLRGLLEQEFQDLQIDLQKGGLQPRDVTGQIRKWIAEYPDCKEWILNATGGLKPMMAGMLRLIPDAPTAEPHIRVIYRELSGQWYEFVRDEDGRDLAMKEIEVDPHVTDSLSLTGLIKAQSAVPDGTDFRVDSPQVLNIEELISHGIEKQWDWNAAFNAAGLDSSKQSGFLFEEFVGGTLLALGIPQSQVGLNLMQSRETQEKEIDLAVNWRGQIYFIDCKLRTLEEEEAGRVDSLPKQIEQASDRKNKLGGRAARYLLLRPNRKFDEMEWRLARAADLDVLDQSQAFLFFEKLSRWFGIEDLPKPILKAHKLLEEDHSLGAIDALGNSKFYLNNTASKEAYKNSGILDLRILAREMRQDWLAIQIADRQVRLLIEKPSNLNRLEFKQEVVKKLSPYGVVAIRCPRPRNYAIVRIYPHKGNTKPLKGFLYDRLRTSFLD